MRLDKYLKVSRIIKRRTVANEACDAGRVLVNGKVARASYDVKQGDVLELQLGSRNIKAEVVSVNGSTPARKRRGRCTASSPTSRLRRAPDALFRICPLPCA